MKMKPTMTLKKKRMKGAHSRSTSAISSKSKLPSITENIVSIARTNVEKSRRKYEKVKYVVCTNAPKMMMNMMKNDTRLPDAKRSVAPSSEIRLKRTSSD